MRARLLHLFVLATIAACTASAAFAELAEPGIAKADFGITLLIGVLLVVALEFIRPKPEFENARPGADFSLPTAEQGRPIPIFWGTLLFKGPNLGWYGAVTQTAITESIKTGLWSRTRVTTGFEYYIAMQFGLGRGMTNVFRVRSSERQIWPSGEDPGNLTASGTLDINEPEHFGGTEQGGAGGFIATVDVLFGEQTTANTFIARFQDSGAGSTRTPAYVDTAYMLFRERGVDPSIGLGAYIGNSANLRPLEFELGRSVDVLGIVNGGKVNVDGFGRFDVNLASAAYDLLTNTEWGYGVAPSKIDSASFVAAGATFFSEGQGWSFAIQQFTRASDVRKEIERQGDCRIRIDNTTGLWTMFLVRDNYVLNDTPHLDDDEVVKVVNYAPAQWDGTVNDLAVSYRDRESRYKEAFARFIDSANQQLQGGGTIATIKPNPSTVKYPGVTSGALADRLVWRDGRVLAAPLVKCELEVYPEHGGLQIGEVFRWSNERRGIVERAMRVTGIREPKLGSNEFPRIKATEDIYASTAGGFGAPGGSLWEEPDETPQDIPAASIQVFETPRRLSLLDPEFPGQVRRTVWFASRRIGNANIVRGRLSINAGSRENAGSTPQFILAGELDADLARCTANPLGSVRVNAGDDTVAAILAALPDSPTDAEVGQDLVTLLRVGSEFMLCRTAVLDTGAALLGSVFRGVLDSAQAAHSAGDPVYLMFLGGRGTDQVMDVGDSADLKLVSVTRAGSSSDVSAVSNVVTIQDRGQRPYPPSDISVNGVVAASSPSLENGTGFEDYALDFDANRRDFRTTDEIEAITNDAATLFPDFPTANSTEYRITVRHDPTGTNDLIIDTGWQASGDATAELFRNTIIRQLDGIPSAELRVIYQTRHTVAGDVLEALQNASHDFTPTTALTGQSYLGTVNQAVATAAFVVPSTTTYEVEIGEAIAGAVEINVNSGGWSTIIAASGTSGTIALNASDSIQLRQQDPGAIEVFCQFRVDGGADLAFALFI